MPETFEERDIIQPQHLTDIHVVLQDGEFLSHVSEEKVVFSKRWGAEDLEALPLSSLPTKQCLKNE